MSKVQVRGYQRAKPAKKVKGYQQGGLIPESFNQIPGTAPELLSSAGAQRSSPTEYLQSQAESFNAEQDWRKGHQLTNMQKERVAEERGQLQDAGKYLGMDVGLGTRQPYQDSGPATAPPPAPVPEDQPYQMQPLQKQRKPSIMGQGPLGSGLGTSSLLGMQQGGTIDYRQGGTIAGGPPGVDTVPVVARPGGPTKAMMNNGEYALPDRTVDAVGGKPVLDELVVATTGQPPVGYGQPVPAPQGYGCGGKMKYAQGGMLDRFRNRGQQIDAKVNQEVQGPPPAPQQPQQAQPMPPTQPEKPRGLADIMREIRAKNPPVQGYAQGGPPVVDPEEAERVRRMQAAQMSVAEPPAATMAGAAAPVAAGVANKTANARAAAAASRAHPTPAVPAPAGPPAKPTINMGVQTPPTKVVGVGPATTPGPGRGITADTSAPKKLAPKATPVPSPAPAPRNAGPQRPSPEAQRYMAARDAANARTVSTPAAAPPAAVPTTTPPKTSFLKTPVTMAGARKVANLAGKVAAPLAAGKALYDTNKDRSTGYDVEHAQRYGVDSPLGAAGAAVLRAGENALNAATGGYAGRLARGAASAAAGLGFGEGWNEQDPREAAMARYAAAQQPAAPSGTQAQPGAVAPPPDPMMDPTKKFAEIPGAYKPGLEQAPGFTKTMTPAGVRYSGPQGNMQYEGPGTGGPSPLGFSGAQMAAANANARAGGGGGFLGTVGGAPAGVDDAAYAAMTPAQKSAAKVKSMEDATKAIRNTRNARREAEGSPPVGGWKRYLLYQQQAAQWNELNQELLRMAYKAGIDNRLDAAKETRKQTAEQDPKTVDMFAKVFHPDQVPWALSISQSIRGLPPQERIARTHGALSLYPTDADLTAAAIEKLGGGKKFGFGEDPTPEQIAAMKRDLTLQAMGVAPKK